MRIGILGGGIAGLAAGLRARDLAHERGADADVTIFEASERIGGCIETYRDGAFTLELGPDSILIDKPEGIELLRRFGLEGDILAMRPEFRGSRIVRGRRLVPIPDDFRLFTPTSMLSLAKSGLLGTPGVLRAALEPFVPKRRKTSDETLEAFISRRFGRAVFERIAQPLVSGIFGGDPARVSTEATMPYLQDAERRYGSLVRGMQAARRAAGAKAAKPRLVTLRSGLGTLTDALQRELAGSIRTNASARAVERVGSGWMVTFEDGTSERCDALICALPAYETARLLADADPTMAGRLREIRYHSVATITMAFASDALPALPRATGFVVPRVERRKIMALTLTTQKYAGRAPQGTTVLRAFAGGAFAPELADAPDDALSAVVRDEIRDLLGIRSEPTLAIVKHWPNALPEYAVGHRELVANIRRDAARIGALAIAGNAYDGAGIPDCIRSAQSAARAILYDAGE
jgi:oxygen-dependent protoporphyrinogen oxidase